MRRLILQGWDWGHLQLYQPEGWTNIEGQVPGSATSATHNVIYLFTTSIAVVIISFPLSLSLNRIVKFALVPTYHQDPLYPDKVCTFSAAERRNTRKVQSYRLSIVDESYSLAAENNSAPLGGNMAPTAPSNPTPTLLKTCIIISSKLRNADSLFRRCLRPHSFLL